MKIKSLLFVLLFLATVVIQAQTPRMVLAESYTSTTCGPCGSQNPAFDALLHANEDKITSIKYHMNWPAPGNDPMYHHNPVDNNARRSYYNINSVPHVHLDGNYYNGMPSTINQNRINNAAAVPSPFEIRMQHRVSHDEDSVYVTMMIRATEQVSGQLVAHIAVIEKEIHFTSPPGTNGERDFYNVMKAMLPSRNGTSLSDFPVDSYVVIEAAWELQNVYNVDQIAAVGFVQDNTSKHVHQAANSSTEPLEPFYDNDAAVGQVMNVTTTNCSGTVSPVIKITNYGANELVETDIMININAELVHTINWTGNLAFLESAVIDAGELGFVLEEVNTLTVSVEGVNGQEDEYLLNNAKTTEINQSPFLTGNLLLFFLLDNSPEETTWEILNSQGTVVMSGGPYSTPGGVVSLPVTFDAGDCYELIVYDAGGNGMCCSNGTGYYALIANGNEAIFSGQGFGASDRNEFTYGFVGLDETKHNNDALTIYPNPADNKVNISLGQEIKANSYSIRLMEPSGRLVMEMAVPKENIENVREIDLKDLAPGLYLVSIVADNKTFTKKLFVK